MKGRRTRPIPESGFTLIEILLAVTLMAVVMVVAYLGFSTVTLAWQRGTRLADRLHHADFAIEQLVMALKSAYYPPNGVDAEYGFWLKDDGDGPGSIDTASWVKLGSAMVGKDAVYAGGPHRVEVGVEETARGEPALAVRAWGLLSQVEDFNSDDLPPQLLSTKVIGINYRFQDPETDENAEEIEWIDEWEDTNRIPKMVELTVYMEPTDTHEKAVEIRRIIKIPTAPLAWLAGAAPIPEGLLPPVSNPDQPELRIPVPTPGPPPAP